jgi:hypothetical protein
MMQRNMRVSLGVAGAVLALLLLWWLGHSGSSPSAADGADPRLAWFTVDDGKTWFADDVSNLPPFEHNGKQAVMCFVYKTPAGEPFAGYLMRYTPEGKRMREKQLHGSGTLTAEEVENRLRMMEVKRPGEAGWTRIDDSRAEKIQDVRAPAGSGPVEVVHAHR